MDNYIQYCRHSLENVANFDSIHVVVGNESCDLDSAVSAIVYAYLLYISKYKRHSKILVVPLLNTNRNDLLLKTELLFWLQDAIQLSCDELLVKHEVYEKLKNSGKKILVTLVDHNEDAEFGAIGKIVEIVDHHMNLNPNRNDINVQIDASVGSCCTLIAKKYLDFCEKNTQEPDIQVVLMLYGPIVFDTVCFSPSAQRFNNDDKLIAQKIETILGPDSFTREEVYQQLTKAKNSLSNLNVEQILRRDLKVTGDTVNGKIAVASLSGHLVQEIIPKETFPDSLISFSQNNHFNGVIVLGIKGDQQTVERDLAAYIVKSDLFEKIRQKLEDPDSKLLLKSLWSSGNAVLWQQKNVTASRKVVLPLISSLLNNNEILMENEVNTGSSNNSCDNQTIDNSKRKLFTQLSTADVDPEFVVNYKAETVDFPDTPQHETEQMPESGKPDGKIGKNLNLQNAVYEALNKNATESGEKASVNNVSSVKKVSSPHQPPIESINYYESYFMDSFVGEFTGEVDVDKVNENEDVTRWCSDTNLDAFNSELSFDSFGPESLIYSSHLENVEDKNEGGNEVQQLSNENDLQSLSVSEPQLGDKVKRCFDESSIKTSYELTSEEVAADPVVESCAIELKKEKNTLIATREEHANEVNIPSDDNSQLEEETRQSQQNDVCLVKSPEEESPCRSFQRNSTLTQSQRRKISPKLKLEEILNTSDDAIITPPADLPHNSFNTSILMFNENQMPDVNSPQSMSESGFSAQAEFKGTHVRQNSNVKKKISVNRDLLESDDIGNESPETDRRKVMFVPSEETQPKSAEKIAELSLKEENDETRNWRPSCPIGSKGEIRRIDLKVIEPYKKVLSHGGYYHHYNTVQLTKSNSVTGEIRHIDGIDVHTVFPAPGPAVIIFSACYLPDRSRRDYGYVMDNLFMYVLTTLHELVADDYILIYFHNAGGTGMSSNNMPTFSWLKRCYYMIDRRLRKNLKSLFLVHPTFWLKTLVIMTKPFISSKFARKLQFVNTLSELNDLVPIESTIIPPPVKQVEFSKMIRQKKRETKR